MRSDDAYICEKWPGQRSQITVVAQCKDMSTVGDLLVSVALELTVSLLLNTVGSQIAGVSTAKSGYTTRQSWQR